MSWYADVTQGGDYIIRYRIASYSGEGSFAISNGTTSLIISDPFPSTGGWQNWITIEQEIKLEAGITQLVLTVLDDGWNIHWLDISFSGVLPMSPSQGPTSEQSRTPSSFPSRFPSKTPSLMPTQLPSALPSKSPSQSPTLKVVELPVGNSPSVFPSLAPFKQPDAVHSNSPTDYIDTGCQIFKVAGATRIEAEAFCSSSGVRIEPTSDSWGGENVGYLESGDWMTWYLDVPEEDNYFVSFRVASFSGDGAYKISTNSVTLAIKNTLPSTGGWQNWVTIRHEVKLSAGRWPLELTVLAAGWNINWIEIEKKEPVVPSGFVKANKQEIVDPNGQSLLLRGMGLGGWMIQEPYMLRNDFKGQYEFFAELAELMGQTGVADYQQAWLDKWMTFEDVQALKAAGFNSIRAALHYNLFTLPIENEPVRGNDTWIESSFARLDLLLEWCIAEKMYLIIDLHAAPGGQGRDSKISDFDDTKPSLWEDPENVRKTIALWKKIAVRYANEPWVAGYDLLNEPNWGFSGGNGNGCDDTVNGPLKDFYDRVIVAIREVDRNHAIYIEGNCWGNNHNGLWPMNDDTVVLSFHRYWIDNSVWTIQDYLSLSNQHQVPLWMGESGENTDGWYRDSVRLLESNSIGWAYWTLKKMQSTSGVFSMSVPTDYQTLLYYWRNGGSKPDATFTRNAMMQVADASLLRHVVRNDGAILALTGCLGAPFASVSGRTRLEAEGFCNMQRVSTENTQDIGGGQNSGWPSGDGWIAHNINVNTAGTFHVHFRYSSMSGGGLQLEIESSGKVLGRASFSSTGGWQSWASETIQVQLPAGKYTVLLRSTSWGWNLNYFEITQTI
ncbi:hypothetical protein FisN_UnNu122 [Fistulifera solaris]|uniref:CBM6 domain-containing protein n=1 Tax=Fistulifera solaris TaxID=1519565 RepID=A0A1Z5KTI3_FISSO|nr:hypothetical protein FisN_UnNu122 [Fistulifera solaris]|eukprot:GAX29633.1 hypothetical protein FisN_UnNu122 [Fistulifera solaris]